MHARSSCTARAGGRCHEFNYHHGMHAKVEIKVQAKPFLSTLLPAIEKWIPD